MKFSFDNHPAVRELGSSTLEEKLWVALAEAGVVVAPGNLIQSAEFKNQTSLTFVGHIFAANSSVLSSGNTGNFRISFSYAEVRMFCSCG